MRGGVVDELRFELGRHPAHKPYAAQRYLGTAAAVDRHTEDLIRNSGVHISGIEPWPSPHELKRPTRYAMRQVVPTEDSQVMTDSHFEIGATHSESDRTYTLEGNEAPLQAASFVEDVADCHGT
ncbi:hypothetical protein GCM10009838_34980 [Catenulispora subtropica]|uniref:Uncharacterized protein n=1 Tax=Catenulispora subtropica TaxID=450798 RepID=A0ABN2RNZ6_9ACTN